MSQLAVSHFGVLFPSLVLVLRLLVISSNHCFHGTFCDVSSPPVKTSAMQFACSIALDIAEHVYILQLNITLYSRMIAVAVLSHAMDKISK